MLNTITSPVNSNSSREPMAHCKNCGRCSGNTCLYFGRRISKNYNRCIEHTWYNPNNLDAKYVSPPESWFREIQDAEAKRIKKINRELKHLYRVK